MFLEYGLSAHGELIRIDAVPRGLTSLVCPYCGVPLMAKKGDIKAAHFAHAGPTCAESVSDNAQLPAYDRFDLHLPPKVYADLKRYYENDSFYNVNSTKLIDEYHLVEKDYNNIWQLTKLGKIPLGLLSLKLFLEYQEPAFMRKHEDLEEAARDAQASIDFERRLTDLRLYRAQWRRLLTCSLYFIEVSHAAGVLYKIGVTTRDIAARLSEIERDLIPHFGAVALKVLDIWPHRGSIELYFKHRYAQQQQQIGALTEYFSFEDVKPVLSYDLRRMPKKELSPFERVVYLGGGSELENEIYAQQIESRRRARIVEGMQRAARAGRAIGRPNGKEDIAAFLDKPTSIAILSALGGGLSIRDTARELGVSTATVQKVKRAHESGSL